MVSNKSIYVKKADYDECIYIVKHTDKTAQAFIDVMQGVDKRISDQALNEVTQDINAKIKSGEIVGDAESIKPLIQKLFDEKIGIAKSQVLSRERFSILKALEGLRFEAVLNYQQF